ncbi:MAG: anhydro-N-acetylmuramic acid kinase, partial [Alphaproteobacteria bacterium]|nr:anhydro-N-acetylmuramic acid kinase [Alphaproteobacteria bacterium]MBU1830306.1 anhydro-N-acetylmuramic acid kinase [Alphaproteobacteria bacterium]
MSGTSLDGVDVAMVLTDGVEIFKFGDSHFRPYSEPEQALLRAELGGWSASKKLCEVIETAHAEALSTLKGFDLIGFHGQTLAHDPGHGRTCQAGDGAVLAEVFDVPVVWDFRSADVEMGGQGAPLAPFYHHALARLIGATSPVAFLNMGGVGNLTWVDPRVADPAEA